MMDIRPIRTGADYEAALEEIAGLGGFFNRTSDGFPGPQTLWIGLQRPPTSCWLWRPSAAS
jgi:hypothetical protein